jgi:predicted lipoprotein with Yx(FWY)xxD motif
MEARLTTRTATVSILATVFSGIALAAPSPSTLTVTTSTRALGMPILVNPKGRTLYHYLREAKGTLKCTGTCTALFPPLIVAAGTKPVAGPGLTAAKLGTIMRPDGRLQVTYNGLALYLDYYDKPGDANGQGQQAVWFAVTPAGQVTKTRPSGPAASETSASQPATAGSSTAAGGSGVGAGVTGAAKPSRQDLGCGVENNASNFEANGDC